MLEVTGYWLPEKRSGKESKQFHNRKKELYNNNKIIIIIIN
jgi:hypothetical protein